MNEAWFAVRLMYEREDGSKHEFTYAGKGIPIEVQREAMIRMMEGLQGVLHRWTEVHGTPTTEWGAREIMRLSNPGPYGPGITIAK